MDSGEQLARCRDESERLGILDFILGGKSAATLNKRSRCITRWMSWCNEQNDVGAFLPFSTNRVVQYVLKLKHEERQSAIREFLETLQFCRHVMGIHFQEGLFDSPVLKGIYRSALTSRKEVKQARPLTVVEILALEGALISGQCHPVDRFALGVFLFQLYSRARVSDIRNIDGIVVDITGRHGYIEARTHDHKSKRISGCIGLALHLVAPIQGLCSEPWGLAFVDAAAAAGFEFTKGHKGPLLPAVDAAGNWVQRAVTAGETGDWLIKVLRTLLSADPTPGISSHSDLELDGQSRILRAYSHDFGTSLHEKQEIFGELLA